MMKGLKSLFVVEDETTAKIEIKEKELAPEVNFKKTYSSNDYSPEVSFPETTAWVPEPQISQNIDCSEDVLKLRQLYNDGFTALNKDGYDFFEIYQVLKGMNTSDVNAVRMAVTMGKTMNPNLTSESLTADAKYYIEEISKNHQSFVDQGLAATFKIETDKKQLNSDLSESLEAKEEQVKQLLAEIGELRISINNIDSTFEKDFRNIKCRMMANDIVKKELVENLTDIMSKL